MNGKITRKHLSSQILSVKKKKKTESSNSEQRSHKFYTNGKEVDLEFSQPSVTYCSCLFKSSVSQEIEPCQYSQAEGSNQGKWLLIFCVWVHEREPLPNDEEQVINEINYFVCSHEWLSDNGFSVNYTPA